MSSVKLSKIALISLKRTKIYNNYQFEPIYIEAKKIFRNHLMKSPLHTLCPYVLFILFFYNFSTNTKKVTVSNWATTWVSAAYKMTPNWYGLYMLPRSRVTENTRKLMRSLKESTIHRWTWCPLFRPRNARSWLATLIIAIICTSGRVCQTRMMWSRQRKPTNCRAMCVSCLQTLGEMCVYVFNHRIFLKDVI